MTQLKHYVFTEPELRKMLAALNCIDNNYLEIEVNEKEHDFVIWAPLGCKEQTHIKFHTWNGAIDQ
jgi:hypothetical protein